MTASADDELVSGLYGITAAAELVGLGEQTLRLYESRGLLTPARTAGGTRRYSESDLAVLRRVTGLLELGLNLAGAAMVMRLESENARLRAEIERGRPGSGLRRAGPRVRP
ncbi:MAG TPA: MerR family transcriptional regulator [Lacisediminihabitans sp.]|uniref:MerR family transcriptional regulator n=1 Tax=Lacisediminihabitans sp. TaxID=2787631 RepID=UPI002ED7A112